MTLLHELLVRSAHARPSALSVSHGLVGVSYEELARSSALAAAGFRDLGLQRYERVGVWLPKSVETVAAVLGASMARGVFVPINPLLKRDQVIHILNDCAVSVLVTSSSRAASLGTGTPRTLRHVVLVDGAQHPAPDADISTVSWSDLVAERPLVPAAAIDTDMAAIFYTSGSTGRPKGVVVSHRNLVAGAESVAQYLGNTGTDRLLAVLPFSFDYGFNQLASALKVGASVHLLDYLVPKDVLTALEKREITGMAGVPSLWNYLTQLEWSPAIARRLRYVTNSGGVLPRKTLAKLRSLLPQTRVFLMYGLTEAFRSTYLDPERIDERPGSIGKAIPNAEIMVVRQDGSPCSPGEPGELVHRGALVAMGYWNDRETTAKRFRPVPGSTKELPFQEIAVWSGDTVTIDDDGYLYFVGRHDEMIKTSGYRVSPTEVEASVLETRLATQAIAVGVAHETLGQAIAVVVQAPPGEPGNTEALLAACRRTLPTYMLPTYVDWRADIPVNPNGKLDRALVARELRAKYVVPQ